MSGVCVCVFVWVADRRRERISYFIQVPVCLSLIVPGVSVCVCVCVLTAMLMCVSWGLKGLILVWPCIQITHSLINKRTATFSRHYYIHVHAHIQSEWTLSLKLFCSSVCKENIYVILIHRLATSEIHACVREICLNLIQKSTDK